MEAFSGRVVGGKRLGRTLGFPTANIETEGRTPPRGVYAAVAEADGRRYRAVMNIGRHPTAPEGPPTIEVHLLDFSGDLYGHILTVEPVCRLRGEIRFDSLEALEAQLQRDCARARALVKPGGAAVREAVLPNHAGAPGEKGV
ncbi:MAG: riboflavin kinase [Clostridia bacterium]|nr:riboflavin kinase [Clostridia bacterium]